jgi:hypothetical protein
LPTPVPGAAGNASGINGIAFDTATGQLVAFGSCCSTGSGTGSPWPAGETWLWDGTRWSQAASGSGPVPRVGASMAYDAVRKVVVMHGGYDQHTNWSNDTWAWDGARWSQLSPLNSPPADGYVREQPMCWDGQRVLMVNEQGSPTGVGEPSQTWWWDGSSWTQISATGAPALGFAGFQPVAMAYDTTRHVTLLFSQVSGVPTTWAFDGTRWTQVATSGSTSAGFSMAADDARSNVVLFGANGDTWIWNGSRWTVQNPLHSPPGRAGAAMAYDPVHRVVVMIGGVSGSSAGELKDTWIWNGSDWGQVA